VLNQQLSSIPTVLNPGHITGIVAVTRDAAHIVVPIVGVVAVQHGTDPTPHIREMLINALADPTQTFQLTAGRAAQLVDQALRLLTGSPA
jgi:hypothetical protein